MKVEFYSGKFLSCKYKNLVIHNNKYFILFGLQGMTWRIRFWDSLTKEGSIGPIRYGVYDYIPF